MGKKNKKSNVPPPSSSSTSSVSKSSSTANAKAGPPRSLHLPTSAPAVIQKALDGTLFVPGRVTGSQITNLWDFSSPPSLTAPSSSSSTCTAPPPLLPPPSVAVVTPLPSSPTPLQEWSRHTSVLASRQQLLTLAVSHGLPSLPALCWERWQGDCQLQLRLRNAADRGAAKEPRGRDYLLPWDGKILSGHLVDDLVRAGLQRDSATSIARKMAESGEEAVKGLAAVVTGKDSAPSKKCPAVNVARHKHTYDVSLTNVSNEASSRLLKLNVRHYDKLALLHRLHSGNKGEDKPSGDAAADASISSSGSSLPVSPSPSFASDLYVLLSRYNSVLGHGLQCALPEDVFALLHSRLSVSFECFASPLNCRYRNFCSAFPDVDKPFGSVGCFFEGGVTSDKDDKDRGAISSGFYPVNGGSFEVNPPFVENVMSACVQKLSRLLSTISSPLSFVVIVPGWSDSPAYASLLASPFNVFGILVAASDHGYVDGAQHQRQDRFVSAQYDTYVCVLQNEGGRERYGGWKDRQFERDVREAFAKGIPTKAMLDRRKKAGRGFGELDGGRGGKKNKKNKLKGSERS